MRTCRWIALLLSVALLLTGCGSVEFVQQVLNGGQSPISTLLEAVNGAMPMVSFSEMPYEHPDEKALQETFDAAISLAETGQDVDELMTALDTAFWAYRDFYTFHTIAMIRADSDQTDAYWQEEYAYCDRLTSQMEQWLEQMLRACAQSPARGKLEREGYFQPHELDEYEESDNYNDEIVALYQRESELVSAYRELCADPEITIEGETVRLNEYLSRLDLTEEDYEEANLIYMWEINEEAAELYRDLILLRREIAEKAGFDDYETCQYAYYGRDYAPQDVEGYLSDIRDILGPYRQTLVEQGEYDAITYPAMSEGRLMSSLEESMEQLGSVASNAFAFMQEYELYNVTVSMNKAPTSYTVYLPSYDVPYLFVDTYADVEDTLYTAHEFGHFLAAYENYGVSGGLDLDETYSQGMEYLTLEKLRTQLSDSQYEALSRIKLLGTLDTYTLQSALAAFEKAVYALPEEELNAETFNALSLSCMQDYGCGESGEEYSSLYWTQITHLFEMPFYVLSYCVSVDSAVQIYQKELESTGAGWDAYCELLYQPETPFLEALTSADLASPLQEGRAEQVRALLQAQLP